MMSRYDVLLKKQKDVLGASKRIHESLVSKNENRSVIFESGRGDCSTNMESVFVILSYLKSKDVTTKSKLTSLIRGEKTFGLESFTGIRGSAADNIQFVISHFKQCSKLVMNTEDDVVNAVLGIIKNQKLPASELTRTGDFYSETTAQWRKYGGILRAPSKTDIASMDGSYKFSMKDANRARGLDYMRGNLIALAESAIDKSGKRKAWEADLRKDLLILSQMEEPSLSRLDPATRKEFEMKKDALRKTRDEKKRLAKGNKDTIASINAEYAKDKKSLESEYKYDASEIRTSAKRNEISNAYKKELKKFDEQTKIIQEKWRSAWENLCKDKRWLDAFWYEAISGEIMFGRNSVSTAKDVIKVNKDFTIVDQFPVKKLANQLSSTGCQLIPKFGTKGAGYKIFLTAKVQIESMDFTEAIKSIETNLNELNSLSNLETRVRTYASSDQLNEGMFDTVIQKLNIGFDYISDKSERILTYIVDKAASLLDGIIKLWEALKTGVKQLYDRINRMFSDNQPFHSIFSEIGIIVEEPVV